MINQEVGTVESFWTSSKKGFRNAFDQIADLRIKDGLSALTKIGGEGIAAALSFAGLYELYNTLKNPKLKPYQKILPAIGYTLSIMVGVPAVVAFIAGSSVLLPPFLFAASVVCLVRNVGTYLEERAERNNLRKELITPNSLWKSISKAGLPKDKTTHIVNSIVGQREIYLELYALRDMIIQGGKIPIEDKHILVKNINEAIAQFAQGNNAHLALDTKNLPDEIKKALEDESKKINGQLDKYKDSCEAVKQLDLPKSLAKSVQQFKLSQESVFSQDLPPAIKDQVMKMLMGNKVNRKELNDLYLRIGQHYLNNTAIDQLKVQDDVRAKLIVGYVRDIKVIKDCENYYQQPRQVYGALHALQTAITHQDLAPATKQKYLSDINGIIAGFKSSPDTSEYWLKNLKDKFAHEGPPLDQAVKKAMDELSLQHTYEKIYRHSELFQMQSKLQQLPQPTHEEQKKLAGINMLIQSIEQHQVNSLQQFSSQFGQQFESPKVKIEGKNYDLIQKMTDPINKRLDLSERFKRVGRRAHTRSLERLFKKQGSQEKEGLQKQLDKEQSKLQDEFNERFSETFEIMAKKERLRFLERSVPRRLANVFVSGIVALASLATTFIIPAVASPAAPAAAAATVVIGAIGTGLVIGSALNSADLVRQELKSEEKMHYAQTQIKEGITPDISNKSVKKARNIELERLTQSKSSPSDVAVQALGVKSSKDPLHLESNYAHHNHQVSMHDALVEEIKSHDKLKVVPQTPGTEHPESDKEHATSHKSLKP